MGVAPAYEQHADYQTPEAVISAIELDLFAAMIDQGDLSPIHKGWITQEHLLTNHGQALYYFLKNYRSMTGGHGRVPSRKIVLERFGPAAAELPDSVGNEDLEALAYETRLAKVRAELRALSENAAIVAEMADPVSELGSIRKQFDIITADISSSSDLTFGDALDDQIIGYDAGDLLPEGMPWLWPTLTEATKGLHKQEFIVLCGRPKSRKTFTALAVGAHAFTEYGARVLCISPEMPSKQMMLRWTATVACLRYAEFKNSGLDEDEEKRLFATAARYRSRHVPIAAQIDEEEHVVKGARAEDVPPGTEPLFVVVKGTGQGLGFVASKVEEYRPDIVLVDSFYRLQSGDGKSHEADWKAVTTTSRGLKDLAMSEDVSILGTHQLNRDADKGIGSLANLALADAIGQDADLIGRVITARRARGNDKSGIVLLGARETAIQGVMINNVPCSDYSEIEEIKKLDKVLALLTEEEEQDGDENEGKAAKKMGVKKRSNGIQSKTRITKKTRAAIKDAAKKAGIEDAPA